MRNLSALMKSAIAAQETGEQWAYIMTITHGSLGAPIRATSAPENVVSNGHTYLAYGFSLAYPEDTGDNIGTVSIVIDNVDQWLTSTIRGMIDEAEVTIGLIMLATPDVVEVQLRPLFLVDATYKDDSITATLSYEPFLSEPFPGHTISPEQYPGAF